MLRASKDWLLPVAFLVLVVGGCADGEGARPTETARPPFVLPTAINGNLSLEPKNVRIGDFVTVTATGWADGVPLTFYLLTDEQRDAGIQGILFDESRVQIAELIPRGGRVSFDFAMEQQYVGEDGSILSVEPSQRFHILALQGNSGRRTGPITVQ